MYNHLQAKKDETCSEEQVTTVQERIQDEDTFKEEITDIVQLCNNVEQHH